MNEFTKRDVSQKEENSGCMDDPSIKVNIRPSQRNLPEHTGQSQADKRKIGFKGYRQDSQPKGLEKKACEDDEE